MSEESICWIPLFYGGGEMPVYLQYLIVCPFVFFAGLVDAIAGGGGLISIPAYLLAGIPVHHALGTNKMSSTMGAVISAYRYGRDGFVPWKVAIPCVFATILGAQFGARLSLLTSDFILKIVILVFLPVVAFFLLKKDFFTKERKELDFTKALLYSLGISLAVGLYDGFYGPGTGVFLIILLSVLSHFSLQNSNGIAKILNLASNVTSLVVFLLNGVVIVPLGITAGVCSVIGTYIGTRIFETKGAKVVKPVMLLVIGIFFIKILYELLTE